MNQSHKLIGAIDAGGTTFKCAIANQCGEIVERSRVPTTQPEETIAACVDFFRKGGEKHNSRISQMGIASFGPLDIDPASPHYGTIMQTPKPGWSETAVKRAFEIALGVPVSIQTDVNAALAAEMKDGAARGSSSAGYVTVGTGIGAGIFANGRLLGEPSHPEFGHIYVKRHHLDHDFEGLCPFHGECLEGLASAAAFEARHGDPKLLNEDHIGWRIEAFYLAQACISLSLTARLERIVLGGGLLQAPHLISLVRAQYRLLNADYLSIDPEQVRELIATPKFGDDAGLRGAIEVAFGYNADATSITGES